MGLKFAISGAGGIAAVHARAIQATPEADLVALQYYHPEKAGEFTQRFNISRVAASVEELVSGGGIDALVICTPNYLHAPQAITALEAGIHVLVEKPMAMNAPEAEKMLEASQRSGAVLMVAHCWRFDPQVQWLQRQVEAGRLGKIVRTKGYGAHVNWGPGGWFGKKELSGGGALVDMGIHAIDTARFLTGSPNPSSVYARVGTYYSDAGVDDTGVLMVEWDNGVVSYIESGWWQPHSDGAEASTQLYGARGFGQIFPTHLEINGVKLDPNFPPRSQHEPHEMYNNQIAHFVECILSGRTPVPGGAEGLVNMRVVDAAYESARTGKVVELSAAGVETH